MELKLIFLIIFAVVSVVHLISIFLEVEIIRAISKSCLMPILLAVYIFGAQNIFWPVILALVLGFTGDVFLLNIKKLTFFRLGLASFLLGHIFYIIALSNFAHSLNITVLVISIVIAVILEFIIFKIIRPSNDMKIPVIVYETVIMAMVIFALQVFLSFGTPFGAFIFAGSLFFLLSDAILARFTFCVMPRYGNIYVMLTYIPAQLLIILGFCGIV